jgi:type VI secretion system secreted protein VgrG
MHSFVNRDEISYIHGICKCIKTKGFTLADKYIYEITIVPKLWNLSLTYSSKVYIDVSIKDIITNCMKSNNFAEGKDYEMNLTETYTNLEFVCQYNESDLNYLTRWLEVYGIYYYFKNTANENKIIFADNNNTQSKISHSTLEYSSIEHRNNEKQDRNIFEFNSTSIARSTSFQNDHYDGTRQSLPNTAASVATKDNKTYRTYGGNPQIRDSFSKFDALEQERLDAYKFLGRGKSTVVSMQVGGVFSLNSPFTVTNNDYLITKIQHSGNQSQLLQGKNGTINAKLYENYFEVIPYATQYRPQKITPKPYFNGLINASIDGTSNDKALVDELGRYKILLPFDTLAKEAGKASVPIRVVQPTASNQNSGMHFKLLKGDEVILGFREGDVDRPVILGAVNNTGKVIDVDDVINPNADIIKRKNTTIGLDDDVLLIRTPRRIEIIG